MFAYLIILITHYRHRRLYGCPPQGRCQLVGFPYTSWIAIAGLLITIATMPLIPGQGSGLYVGLLLTGLYLLLYIVFRSVPLKWLNKNNAFAKPLPLILEPEQQNLEQDEKNLK